MASKSNTKKNLLVGFDLSIPRQKSAYETLLKRKRETGLPYNIMIHEALEVYARINEGSLMAPFAKCDATQYDIEKTQPQKSHKKMNQNTLEDVKDESYELTEEELDDPYLLDNLGALYSDEK